MPRRKRKFRQFHSGKATRTDGLFLMGIDPSRPQHSGRDDAAGASAEDRRDAIAEEFRLAAAEKTAIDTSHE